MKKLLAGWVAVIFLFSSCSEVPKKPIILSVDIWIGAAPLYYAHAMGWLKEGNIEVIFAKSITENIANYSSGASDMVTGTQHEFFRLRKIEHELTPVMVYDRSYGGDVVMVNRTLAELKADDAPIDLFLEKDTVGEELWSYLVRYEGIAEERFTLQARNQDEIGAMKNTSNSHPTVLVTYNPHNLALEKNGFVQIASSKDKRYIVVDGVYSTQSFAEQHPDEIKALREALVRALDVYAKDPKAFYEKVKFYLGNPSYEEFQAMRHNIEWTLPAPSAEIKSQLGAIGYPVKAL